MVNSCTEPYCKLVYCYYIQNTGLCLICTLILKCPFVNFTLYIITTSWNLCESLSSSTGFSFGEWPRPFRAGLPAEADARRALYAAAARGIGPCLWSTALSWLLPRPWQHQLQARPGKGWGVGVCILPRWLCAPPLKTHACPCLAANIAWPCPNPAVDLCAPTLKLMLTFHLFKLILGPWPRWCWSVLYRVLGWG